MSKHKFWKFVKRAEDGTLISPGNKGILTYTPGEEVVVEDADPDPDPDPERQCRKGIHCLRWDEGKPFDPHNVIFADHVVELEVDDDDLIHDGGPGGKCRVRRAMVVREVSPLEEWMLTGNGDQRWMGYRLSWAASGGHLDVVEFLVEKGADVRALHDEALRIAASGGHLDVVEFLVEKGADVRALNDAALSWAASGGHLDVVEYLEEMISTAKTGEVDEDV